MNKKLFVNIIRRRFLVEIENVDFSDYQYNGSYKQWMDQLKYFPYEDQFPLLKSCTAAPI